MKLFLLEIHPEYQHCELPLSLERDSDVGFKLVLIILNKPDNLLRVVAITHGIGFIYPLPADRHVSFITIGKKAGFLHSQHYTAMTPGGRA